MTSDEVNLWRLACVLVFIMALSALVVGSLAYTRSNNVNNPNQIFLGSTSLTDFAATQTVKTRNILGSTLVPDAIATAGTLFNGDVNVNSVSFTGQGLTLYSDTTGLFYILDASPDTKNVLGTTDFSTLALTGIVTSVGQTTSIPNGNITNAMLGGSITNDKFANVAVANLSGTLGATTNTGTLDVTGELTAGALNVFGLAAFQAPTVINSNFTVTADTALGGNLGVTGHATVSGLGITGTTDMGGNVTMANALTVDGAVTMNSSLHVTGTSNFVGGFSVATILSNVVTLTNGTTGNILLSTVTTATKILVTEQRPLNVPALGTPCVEITSGTGFIIRSLNTAGLLVLADTYTIFYLVIF